MASRQVQRKVRRPARRPAPRPASASTRRRGPVHIRLRVGFILVAMVLSVFGGRLVQLQGIDPHSYAAMAAAENVVDVVLPAERGEILDRDGEALADSSDGLMVLADPKQTKKDAPAIAAFLAKELGVDYASALAKLRKDGSRFQYIKRQVPATQATAAVEKASKEGYQGLWTSRDPLRNYPNGDVAANLVGFLGNDGPLAGLEAAFDKHLAGKDGHAEYDATSPVSGTRMPLGTNNRVDPVDGHDLTLTIDRDLQYYVQQTLMDAVQSSRAESGMAVVMDTQTGEILSLADYPTFDARDPAASPKALRGSNALSNVYEPGSVQKVLTVAGLLDQGLVSPSTRIRVPESYMSGGAPIRDWYPHGVEKLTLAGVIAKSSNIGTVMAADKYADGQLREYLSAFGLGRRTGLGLDTESAGLLASPEAWNDANEDRIDFGQSISVNAVQMTAALNTIANGGVHIDPSLIVGSATNNSGAEVGTDTAARNRVVSQEAASQTAEMMERVINDPVNGTAKQAAVPGYRVSGKTGTAQRVNSECKCYDGTNTVSFGGFAPTDDPRFTVYVAIHNPGNGGGGGSVAGPVFSQIMSFALRRYGVPPTGTEPSKMPTGW
ncbi:penicillin binding protein transpeptidase domain protein [Nocardioidaceae bacterium Broad-1]|uniref:peptidoglycan D,D-transpeptidase FtsI family protein n=1 Tax=Nocardioides luteus TaxID=1844 RepID=UPI0002029427|nr:penicillin-binding protein 2 [Nocardioides luteus]EGD40799.1 penicillin binding protein transpeptidase domain protein [Nocardioidaceae bacterium Broad-1]MBG6097348.1 cell division protein FtsI (penicillin-binding protein 3) [Nocardioides luteus]